MRRHRVLAASTLSALTAATIVVFVPPVSAEPTVTVIDEFGNYGREEIFGIGLNDAGEVFVAGLTTQKATPTSTAIGGTDAFLRKYTTTGAAAWTLQFGTTETDEVSDLAIDADRSGATGDVIVAGRTTGSLEGTNAGNYDGFVRRYTTTGSVAWTAQFGTSAADAVTGVAVAPDGDIVVVGWTLGALYTGGSAGNYDGFVRKYSPDGTVSWTDQFGTNWPDYAHAVAVDDSGNIFVTGNSAGDLGATSAGNHDGFVRKYTPSGTVSWTRQFGTASGDDVRAVATDSSGNVYIVGDTEGALEGTSAGWRDVYIRKFDTAGDSSWTNQFGTSGQDYGYGVAVDDSGHVLVVGSTTGTLGSATAGGTDAFVRQYTTTGTVVATEQFGTTGFDEARVITARTAVYTAGSTYAAFPGLTYMANGDAFLAQVTPSTPANHVPVAVDDTYTTMQGQTLSKSVLEGVLANDSDIDGDTLTVAAHDPTSGRLTLNDNGSLTYAPGVYFTGDDVYTYYISDGKVSASATITITVTPWRLDPDVESGTIADLAGVEFAGESAFGFDDEVTPDTGAKLYWAWTGNDDNVYLYGHDHYYAPAADVAFVSTTDLCSIDATELTYALEERETPDVTEGFVVLRTTTGPYYIAIHVTAIDPPYPGSLDATWWFQTDGTGTFCAGENTLPVAVDDSYSVDEDTTLNVPAATGVLFNDTDADDDALSATLGTDVTNGTLALDSDGSFTYTPNLNYNGSDSFTYTANDGTDNSETAATVTITVNAVNDPPAAPTGLAQALTDDTVLAVGASTTQTSVKFTGTVTDPVEGDQVKLEVELDPVGTAFAADGLQTGSLVTSGSATSVTISSLTPGTYHWRARTVDDEGATSAWVAFGDNAETAADFELHAIPSLLYTGDQLVRHGEDVTAKAVLTSDWAGCVTGQQVVFSLPDDNPLTETIDDGPYTLGTATTNGDGLAELTPIGTSGWEPGVYTVKVNFAATSSCEPSMDEATLTVAPTGAAASGGGFYTLPGNGRVNFGFTVKMVPGTEADPQYKGQLLLINNGKWRLKATLDDYVAYGTSGAATGTGNLYWWDQTLDDGLGDWVLSDTGVPFTISFDDIGKGKHSEDAFGIHIDSVLQEPYPLPNSAPQLIKGGNITIHRDSEPVTNDPVTNDPVDTEPVPPPADDGGSTNNGKANGKNKFR